ncbi:MAG: phosphate acyltransferase PlsX [Bacteroidetes bacterium]|nr:phosphate acyltransferase PlsX [Bacteroidota bacterium]MBU1681034.1 phosphate acyltransferase PlsX [Bacteroidota bacterium]
MTLKNTNCRIAIDAMGGDFAPQNAVIGAVQAYNQSKDFQLILVGDREKIMEVLNSNNLSLDSENIVHTSQTIEMHESPTLAIKTKQDSSIVVGAKLVKDGKADAFVSAGNTGAMMAACTLIIGRIRGVGRPTIGAALPSEKGGVCHVFDVGASVDSKPIHLLEYAIMGSIFVQEMYGKNNPTVGLLSVGEEEDKGNELVKATSKLLKEAKVNFVGNVEGRDILKGTVDIVVCDGYVGNIILKFAESVIGLLKGKIRNYANQGLWNKIRVLFARGTLRDSLEDMDYQSHGGVPLLGINGIGIIGHGSSSELAIKNMVLKAKEMYDKKLTQKIEESLKSLTERNNGS